MRRLSVTRVGPHTSEQRRREAAGVPLRQEVEMHAAGPNLVRVGRIFTVETKEYFLILSLTLWILIRFKNTLLELCSRFVH